MASPFSIFRRHQKTMLAVLTLLAMFAFVFLDPLLSTFSGGAATNPVVVSTGQFGDLREQDVHDLVRQRQMVLNLLEQALVGGGMHPMFAAYQLQQMFGPVSEEAVVNAWLLAQRAESLGMVVDDRAVNEFLNSLLEQFSEGQVRISDLAKLLERDKIPQRMLFAALRKELLARQLRQSFQTSLWGVPPMQRWEYYLRLNRRATVELVSIPVTDFMDGIEAPDDRALRAFFDEHKERLWRPDMPEPAFREPKKIALQYFEAELDDFIDPDAVTDEEVLKYYEENKDTLFLQTQSPDPNASEAADEQDGQPVVEQPVEAEPAETEAEDTAPMAADEVEPTDEEVEPTDEEEEAAAPADQPSEPTEPIEEAAEPMANQSTEPDEPEEESAEPDEPKEELAEPIKEDSGTEEKPAEPASEPSANDGALRSEPPDRRFSFASFVDEATEEPGAPSETMPQEAAEPETPTPETEKQPEPSADEPAAPEPSTLDGQPSKTPLHLPLGQVEGQIRETLARGKAHESVKQLLQSLSARMQRYHDELTLYEVRREDDPTAKPPAALNMGQIAREHGLKSFETNLISPWEARALEIGDSLIDGSEPFIRQAFEELPPFQPAISQADQDYFLFWKTEQTEERVPDWQDPGIQQQVLEAWRLVEARSLTRSHAEALTERVRESGQTLAEFFSDNSKYEVIHAGPFSWMTFGDVPPMLAQEPPRISEVEGVDFTGQQFMGDVFALEEGEVGVTMNQPQTFAYVVRMDSLVPPRAVLWEGFLVDDFGKYAAAGAPNFRQMQTAWQKQVEEAAGLTWEREPWRGRDLD